jgi:hypothetical protein
MKSVHQLGINLLLLPVISKSISPLLSLSHSLCLCLTLSHSLSLSHSVSLSLSLSLCVSLCLSLYLSLTSLCLSLSHSHSPLSVSLSLISLFLSSSRYGQSEEEIEKYIDRISSNEEKFEVYVQLLMWRKAAETAQKMKDLQKLQQVPPLSLTAYLSPPSGQVHRCCRDPMLERQIQEMIARS